MSRPVISISGINELLNSLYDVSRQISVLSDGDLKELADVTRVDVNERFSTSGRGTWVSNSPYTLRRKTGSMPLIDSGNMRNSVKTEIRQNEVICSIPYGGKNKSNRIPVRHQLGIGVPRRKIVDAASIELINKLHGKACQIVHNVVHRYFK